MLTGCRLPVCADALSQPPIVIIPVERWSHITRQ
jgi:hypothetical protein